MRGHSGHGWGHFWTRTEPENGDFLRKIVIVNKTFWESSFFFERHIRIEFDRWNGEREKERERTTPNDADVGVGLF